MIQYMSIDFNHERAFKSLKPPQSLHGLQTNILYPSLRLMVSICL